MRINEISTEKLLELAQSPLKLWQFCVENNISSTEVVDRIETCNLVGEAATISTIDYADESNLVEPQVEIVQEAPTQVVSAIPQQRVLDLDRAREIIEKQLAEYSSLSMRDEQSFDGFVRQISTKFDEQNISIGPDNLPRGFISSVLYDYAQAKKSDVNGSIDLRRAKINNPVTSDEVKRSLHVNFGEPVDDYIVGILDPKYVRNVYSLSNFGIVARDSQGQEHQFPNIEGEKSWGGEEKNKVRDKWLEFVKGKLIVPLQDRINATEQSIGTRNEEIAKLQKEVSEYERKKSSGQIRKVEYRFTGSRGDLDWLEGEFINRLPKSKKQGIIFVRSEDKKVITVVFERGAKTNPQQLFLEVWGNFVTNSSNAKEIEENLKNITYKIDLSESSKRVSSSRSSISELELTLKQLEETKQRIGTINYLGLEGPNFASYLALASVLPSQIRLIGTVGEYSYRRFNIMRGLQQGLDNADVLRRCCLHQRNIDDLILLDFVRDPKVVLKTQRENREVWFTSRGKQRSISLASYNDIIRQLDQGIEPEEIAAKYIISHDFVHAIQEREKAKFDVAFLDYVGPFSPVKKLVLETLLKRRLSDECVIAVTFNASDYANHARSSGVKASQVTDKMFTVIPEICKKYGFTALDFDFCDYQDSNDKMSFQTYHIKREQKS